MLKITEMQILCLNGTLSCVDFMDVIIGDISFFFVVPGAVITHSVIFFVQLPLGGYTSLDNSFTFDMPYSQTLYLAEPS